jgi:hypothetical protein
MARKTHHVVPNPKGGWSVKKGGSSRASKTFDTKKDATDYGRQVSKNQNSELVVHKKDGRIQTSNSHGKDPIPPKDKDTHK